MHTIKYPILFVHGVNCRDDKPIIYWGRILGELKKKGYRVYQAEQDAWGTIENNALHIKNVVKEILEKEECERVNIIAHSKGGLECRYLISKLDMDCSIASLTTISTPHMGVQIADQLCTHKIFLKLIGIFVNTYARMLGDTNPDFCKVMHQLQVKSLKAFNETIKNSSNVYYQSFGSVMNSWKEDITLGITYLWTKKIQGSNDGLVPLESAKWDNFVEIPLTKNGNGLSHQDIVDYRKKDRNGINIIEIYEKIIIRELCDRGF